MATVDTVLNLPTEKQIKAALNELMEDGLVLAIPIANGGIRYYDAETCNPALHKIALTVDELKARRARNAQAKGKNQLAQ